MITAADLARQLRGKANGNGAWIARCPAHDDKTASLSIGEGEDGKLLLNCFAGCDFADILKAAGVEPNGHDHTASKPRIVARYTYRDTRGDPVFEVRRYEPKDFRQARFDQATGMYISGKGCMQGVEMVPYNLPEVVSANELFICEGERDCDNLDKLGLAATTNPAGAGKWPKVFSGWFEGRHVTIIPDNDETGINHARDVAAKLQATAASIKIFELPGLPPKGDVSDWIAAGGTADELRLLVEAAPYWDGNAETEAAPNLLAQVKAQLILWPALVGRKAPRRRFILPSWIPAGCCTLLHGYGGVGKTLLAQQIGTAAILRCQFLGEVGDACPVLGWFGEDDHDELWRRQESINAALGIADVADLDGKLFWRPCPGDDITLFKATSEGDYKVTPLFDVLRDQLLETAAKLTILDSSTQIAAIPEGNRPLVTRCIQTLTRLCIETGTTIILIGHNSRGTGDFSGSTAWENSVRSRLHMKREKDENGTETIKLCRAKANYAALEDGVALEWHEGAYRCTDHRFETGSERLDRQCREREIDRAFLAALDKLTEQRRATSPSRHASNFAPKIMAAEELANGYSRRDIERSMSRLFNAGEIVADAPLWQKPNRHWATGVGRKT